MSGGRPTKVVFGGADISDMIKAVVISPWLHFPWGDWEDFRDNVPGYVRATIDPHEGHDLLYRYDAHGYEFKCRTCGAVAAEQRLAATISAARAEIEGGIPR